MKKMKMQTAYSESLLIVKRIVVFIRNYVYVDTCFVFIENLILLLLLFSDTEKYDVMLSYQWDSQVFVKGTKHFLETNGLRVWMDIEEVFGNINTRMQNGINNSKIIILFITKKYDESDNCCKEFNYADKKRKIIMPVKLEHYNPESELDLIIGNKRYYTFVNNSNIEDEKKDLLRDIKEHL